MRFFSNSVTLLVIAVFFLAGHEGLVINNIATVCSDVSGCQNVTNFGYIASHLQAANISEVTITFLRSFALAEALILDYPKFKQMTINFVGVSREIVITCILDEPLTTNRGFYFKRIESISFVNLTIQNCSVLTKINLSSEYNSSSALYFEDCFNITLQNVNVIHSLGSGAIILNNRGNVEVSESRFENNKLWGKHSKDFSGGSGIFLALIDVHNSSVLFRGCHFDHNNVTSHDIGRGGGIRVLVSNASSRNNISIESCSFIGNGGGWAGGMYLFYDGDPQNNTILVTDTVIEDNYSYDRSGGGVNLGFILKYNDTLNIFGNNYILFKHCNFTANRAALYGGGVAIFATRLARTDPDIHFMVFTDCKWSDNSALAGSAVDIAPSISEIHVHGVFPRPLFQDCSFTFNKLTTKYLNDDNVNVSVSGEGTLLITGFRVQFEGTTIFSDNCGCGLYLSSGTVEFLEFSVTTFSANRGSSGGAVALGTFALILVHDNSSLSFVNNTATLSGGAIHARSSDPHDQLSSRSCFIERYNKGAPESDAGIKFLFEGNKALSGNGNDVFSSSVIQCGCKSHSGNKLETFLCKGNVSAPDNFDIATKVQRFVVDDSVDQSILSSIVPGNRFYEIPVTAYDEYNVSRETIYEVIQDNHSKVLPNSNHVSQNQIQFVGELNASGILKLETDRTILSFNITTVSVCPPGFCIGDDDSKECQCAAEVFFGLSHCENNKAYIIHGFWIGKCLDGTSICSSHCPLGFCVYYRGNETNFKAISGGIHELPSDSSQLELFMCGPTRTGILCGSCGENYSAFYHSYQYSCGDKRYCNYGIPLYVVSELLPLTVMFFAIIIFDIKFTAGCVNGFIFFAQVLDSIAIDANGAITFPGGLEILTSIHRFVYRNLNFDFFSIEELSFCLWEGATTLDAMVMKYVTILYAIGLLVLLIIFMNTWKCKRLFSCWRPRTLQSSAKNGLTAFIVICYSQCARVSFQILSPGILYGSNYAIEDQVAFRRGDYRSFGSEHLIYAIPAFLVLSAMSLIPFFLILYPLIFKVLELFKLNESRLAGIISRLIPVPLLDAFQSSFKDNFRFFAGFYFLYRLLALAAYAYSKTLVTFYTWVELQLIIILALHSVVQPYKVKWHNIIDSLIFANLAIINGITLFNYFKVVNASSKGEQKYQSVTMFSAIQTLLIYVPLFCVVAYYSFWIFRKCKARITSNVSGDANKVDVVQLPPLRDDEDDANKRQTLLSEYTYGT